MKTNEDKFITETTNGVAYFVKPGSIVRTIWGRSDSILLLFAGAAGEFALNKAVDWLYYTGKLPKDPVGRLFSTVAYAHNIVFATENQAYKTIDDIVLIHAHVEQKRGISIPMEAYRDVLFMLIYYSIAAYECLERPLRNKEKEEVFSVFRKMGVRMQLTDLPENYKLWQQAREIHLQNNLRYSLHTKDLLLQYKKQLGRFRYSLLKIVQSHIVPSKVRTFLHLGHATILGPILFAYKLSRKLRIDRYVRKLLLPRIYHAQIDAMDR